MVWYVVDMQPIFTPFADSLILLDKLDIVESVFSEYPGYCMKADPGIFFRYIVECYSLFKDYISSSDA